MSTQNQADFAKRVARLERKHHGLFRPRTRHTKRAGSKLFHRIATLVRTGISLALLGGMLKAFAIFAVGEATYRARIQSLVADLPLAERIYTVLAPDPVTLALSRQFPR